MRYSVGVFQCRADWVYDPVAVSCHGLRQHSRKPVEVHIAAECHTCWFHVRLSWEEARW